MSNTESVPSGVSIRSTSDAVWVEAPELFKDSDSLDCRDFIERVFGVAEVQSLEIDHFWGTAKLICSSAFASETRLARLVNALQSPAPNAVSVPIRSLLDLAVRRRFTRIYRREERFSGWEILRQTPQYLQMRHQAAAQNRDMAQHVCTKLRTFPGVTSVYLWPLSNTLTVRLAPGGIDLPCFLRVADEAEYEPVGQSSFRSLGERGFRTLAASVVRAMNLILAGLSFGMTLIGLIVPGIPTVPFLLLTTYFLVRSSPALNERFLRSKLFGAMLRDWQKYRGMRRKVKWSLVALLISVLVFNIVFFQMSGSTMIVVLAASILSLYMIVRLPTIMHDIDEEIPENMDGPTRV